MKFSNEELIQRVSQGDMRAVSRLITLSENGVPRVREVLSELYKQSGSAHVIGVTGSPGAGKSTLVDHLARQWKARGKKVAILAIDPTSPFSGGAVLGDRIRMAKTAEDGEIFIRSMATRGALGGLSRGSLDAVHILDAAGFDIIFIETVGVGQAEVDIVRTADTCLVILVPGMGDSVQAIKAGILEIADIFVINKADRDGADLVHKDLRVLLSLSDYEESDWKPPILKAIATKGDGTEELTEKMAEHQHWLSGSEVGKERKRRIIEDRIVKLTTELLLQRVIGDNQEKVQKLVDECLERKRDPFSVVEQLVKDATS